MKLTKILEQAPTEQFDIISVEVSDDWGSGTSQQGTLNLPYHQLEILFGRPKSFMEQEDRDVNYEWSLEITYKDKFSPHYGHEEDDDLSEERAIVLIWDKHYPGEEDVPPSQINEWRVNAKSSEQFRVLQEVIDKGIKATV